MDITLFLSLWENMWKSNWSFFWSSLIFVGGTTLYIQNINPTEGKTLLESINGFVIAVFILIYFCVIGAILFKRLYIPRANKKKTGIAIYVNNAADKQFKSINEQFIRPFVNLVNSETNEFDIIVVDDYHSQKYFSELSKKSDDNNEAKVKILDDRRCKVAILMNCLSGGEKDSVFCSIESCLVVAHRGLPKVLNEMLKRDISSAFAPLKQIKVYYETQSNDFECYTKSLNVVFKYILSTTYLHCGYFLPALKMFEILDGYNFSINQISSVAEIQRAIHDRIGFCNAAIAIHEYQCYLNSDDPVRLKSARQHANNIYTQKYYPDKFYNLEGICCYLIDKNIESAIVCMDRMTGSILLAKFNKAFLLMYKSCTVNNVYRSFELYKRFSNLEESDQTQIEDFICKEYNKDNSKKQLLLLLFLIFDYQGNKPLAKYCLTQFCENYKALVNSVQLSDKFVKIKEAYADVEYDENMASNIS